MSIELFAKPIVEHESGDVTTVQLGVIGRSQAGKSVKFIMLFQELLRLKLTGAFYFGLASPLETNERMRDLDQMTANLRRGGAVSTFDPTEFDFFVYRGERPLVRFVFREVIGQVLTETTRNSNPDQIAAYNSYIDDLSAADILWIDIPCPPRRNTDADRDRFVKERMLAREYLKTAIQNRRSTLPCSVMLALTKIDSRFSNAIEAKSRLTDQALAESFECPLDFLYECQRVCKASIVPVSSLGFDTTEVCDIAPPAAPDGRSDTLGIHVDEEKYVLRSGTAPRPFNLAPLLLMSLVCGLANKPTPAGQDQYEMADLLKSLCTDFDRLDGWHVPVNPARRSGTCRSASS